jgi:serine/threonine-protein kinase RsbW
MGKKLKTRIELSIPSTLGYEKVVREVAASLARRLGFNGERIADLKTAVCEACINAIEHGNQCQAGCRIRVTFVVSASRLEVVVADHGHIKASDAEPAAPTIEQKLSGLASPRGMGLMLISQLVDEAGFLPMRRGKGNRFRLMLLRPPSAGRKSAQV